MNYFRWLEADKRQIEQEVGQSLDWRELPERDTLRIILARPNSNMKDARLWPEQHRWLADSLERFNTVFRPRIQALPSSY